MSFVLTLLVIGVIWGYCAIDKISDDKKTKAEYMDRIQEASMKGNEEAVNVYIEALSRYR